MEFEARGNEPRPAPNPPPKIWIGGSSAKALLRAVKHGDGWCPFFSIGRHSKLDQDTGIRSVDDLKNKIDFILGHRREQNRVGEFDVNIAFSSTDNFVNRSRDEADRFIDDLQRLKNAGATWVTLKLSHPNRAAYMENVHWFGEEVIKRI